jgi:LysR family nitrogen assimilation transcriptional regulator
MAFENSIVIARYNKDQPQKMESRQLRYFSEIAEAGSFTAASARLRVAQPALSRQIAALEKELGAALFSREPGGVTLTEAGRILRRHADAIRLHGARAREEIADSIGQVTGWLSLGTTPSIGRLLFGPVAEKMAIEFPKLRMSFIEGVGANLLAGLADGTLDIAITSRPAYAPGIEFRHLTSEPVYLVAAADMPVPKAVTNWEDLAGLPLVVTNQQTTIASWVEELSGLSDATLDLRFRVESAYAALDIVRRGLAYGVLPHSATSEGGFERQLRKVRMRDVRLDRHLAWSRQRDTSAAFNALCDIAANETEEIGA